MLPPSNTIALAPSRSLVLSLSLIASWPQLLLCCGLSQLYLLMPDRTGWGCKELGAARHSQPCPTHLGCSSWAKSGLWVVWPGWPLHIRKASLAGPGLQRGSALGGLSWALPVWTNGAAVFEITKPCCSLDGTQGASRSLWPSAVSGLGCRGEGCGHHTAGLQPHCSRKCCFHSRLTGSATGCPLGWLCVEDAWPFPGGPSWLCLQLPKGFPEPSWIDWSQASGSRQNGEIE